MCRCGLTWPDWGSPRKRSVSLTVLRVIAAMVSPIFIGMVADKFFPSQIVLGVLHVLGGVFLFLAANAADYVGEDLVAGSEGYQAAVWGLFFPFILAHLLCYMPTLALVNSVLFQSVSDPQKDAPPIRTLGTIGWIVSGIVVGSSFLVGSEQTIAFQVPPVPGRA